MTSYSPSMKVHAPLLLSSFVALAMVGPAIGQEATVDLETTFTEDVSVSFDNEVVVKINKELSVVKNLRFDGDISISGSINVEKSALAVLDDKQIIDGSSANSSDANTAEIFAVTGIAGNIQLNAGTGALINQVNGGAVADTAASGSASVDAEIFKLQNIFGNSVTQSPGVQGRDGYDNYAAVSDLSALVGNIQANAAAGNVIQQANSLTIAAATDTVLAEATAAVLQEISQTNVNHNGTSNYASITNVAGLSGNVQVNVASGSAINQVNVMPIASSTN